MGSTGGFGAGRAALGGAGAHEGAKGAEELSREVMVRAAEAYEASSRYAAAWRAYAEAMERESRLMAAGRR